MLHTFENVLTDEECQDVIQWFDDRFFIMPPLEIYHQDHDKSHNPLVYLPERGEDQETTAKINSLIERLIETHYRSVFPDIGEYRYAIHKWFPGHYMEMHSDSSNFRFNEETGETWYERYNDYEYLGILMLNDDFTGGQLVFEKQRMVITPKPGLLALCYSDERCLHAVMPVQSGIRYSLVIRMTRR